MTTDRIATAIAAIRSALADYVFRVRSEAELQDQVSVALTAAGIEHAREYPAGGGRFDIFCAGFVVLELKLKGSAAAVERQAQRYALLPNVDAVLVVTTSRRLEAGLMNPGDVGQAPLSTLGGKPFHVIALRTS